MVQHSIREAWFEVPSRSRGKKHKVSIDIGQSYERGEYVAAGCSCERFNMGKYRGLPCHHITDAQTGRAGKIHLRVRPTGR